MSTAPHAAIERLAARLTQAGVPEGAVRALIGDIDPGPCHRVKGGAICQLTLGHHPDEHLSPDGYPALTATLWRDGDRNARCLPWIAPGPETAAGRAHAALAHLDGVLMSQPVADDVLDLHLRPRSRMELAAWLQQLHIAPVAITVMPHGVLLARGLSHGAYVSLVVHDTAELPAHRRNRRGMPAGAPHR